MQIKTWAVLVGMAATVAAGCTSGGGTPTEVPGSRATGSPATTAPSAPPAGRVPPAQDANAAPAGAAAPAAIPKPARPPAIGRVWITPAPSCDSGWCRLPAGAGSVVLHAQATGARTVEFFLVPTGTGTQPRRSLGVDRDGRDGWSLRWAYPDEPLLAHLTIEARGAGGRAEALPFNVVHDDRPQLGPMVGRVWTTPALSCVDGWCKLPAVAGTMTITAEIRDALGVQFWIDTVDSEPYQLDRPVRSGDRYSVRWTWAHQYDARLRIVAGNNLGQTTTSPLGFRHF
jgi:hypothetical protein